jgi:hypothetical protein
MDISGFVGWFHGNWEQLIQLWLQVIGAASIVVKLTPTLKDDDALKNIMRFLGKYVALNRK